MRSPTTIIQYRRGNEEKQQLRDRPGGVGCTVLRKGRFVETFQLPYGRKRCIIEIYMCVCARVVCVCTVAASPRAGGKTFCKNGRSGRVSLTLSLSLSVLAPCALSGYIKRNNGVPDFLSERRTQYRQLIIIANSPV